uniref:Uncharacterized protein n=1 Tax=Leptospira ellisii TaxID=2023197 RepID=A0A2N0B7X5_9LEPT|nr:hypothetical protein CH379_12275 [Leptospira ellisii]
MFGIRSSVFARDRRRVFFIFRKFTLFYRNRRITCNVGGLKESSRAPEFYEVRISAPFVRGRRNILFHSIRIFVPYALR